MSGEAMLRLWDVAEGEAGGTNEATLSPGERNRQKAPNVGDKSFKYPRMHVETLSVTNEVFPRGIGPLAWRALAFRGVFRSENNVTFSQNSEKQGDRTEIDESVLCVRRT